MLYRNLKKGTTYKILDEVINCTNAQDGEIMVLYQSTDNGKKFVREKQEFLKKFEKIN